MGIMDKLKWGWDKLGVLESLIKKWRPRGCESEKDYENSLYQFLWRELPDHDITRQSAKGRFRADIVIDDEIIIEIKNNLDSTAKYQRLVGQIEEYSNWEGKVILVLVGDTEPNLRKQLLDLIKRKNNSFGLTFFDSDNKFCIIEK